MEIFADYHTHTIHSHGKGTVLENVKRAGEIGLEEIAISDHGPGHLMGIGINNLEVLDQIRGEINAAVQVYPHVNVKLGIEANVTSINGDIDITPEYLDKLDIVQIGLHLWLNRSSCWTVSTAQRCIYSGAGAGDQAQKPPVKYGSNHQCCLSA